MFVFVQGSSKWLLYIFDRLILKDFFVCGPQKLLSLWSLKMLKIIVLTWPEMIWLFFFLFFFSIKYLRRPTHSVEVTPVK